MEMLRAAVLLCGYQAVLHQCRGQSFCHDIAITGLDKRSEDAALHAILYV
jgi:hypothetical protein